MAKAQKRLSQSSRTIVTSLSLSICALKPLSTQSMTVAEGATEADHHLCCHAALPQWIMRCVLCARVRIMHLYTFSLWQLSQERGKATVKAKELHKCRKCQRPHHAYPHSIWFSCTLIWRHPSAELLNSSIFEHCCQFEVKLFVITCQLLIFSPNGLLMRAWTLHAILDHLHHSYRNAFQGHYSYAITQLSHTYQRLQVSLPLGRLTHSHPDQKFDVSVIVIVDIFTDTILNGRRSGPPGSPTTLQARFGWVLAGDASTPRALDVTSHYVSLLTGDELLCCFWKVEEPPPCHPIHSAEQNAVASHFKKNHTQSPEGRFVIPLPKWLNVPKQGESRTRTVVQRLCVEIL